ncbi:hypothetical protein E3N88_28364 [Mikania micrantha]|uniref:Uncharacterized protein n=1 Tax=Mikania micrantha TaxID=192012 RepID=A0A5N6MZ94_9ASTR|nr:hypothetical protein E3N88_28364 [Mikania micrantha]
METAILLRLCPIASHPRKAGKAGVRNDERGRKPCSKWSPGLPEIEKRRKISKYWSNGLVAVRGGGLEGPPWYAMLGKYLRFSRKASRYAKPKLASRRVSLSQYQKPSFFETVSSEPMWGRTGSIDSTIGLQLICWEDCISPVVNVCYLFPKHYLNGNSDDTVRMHITLL